MNFGNCCIRAQKANSSIRTFSKENMTVKVSGIIVDAHLIPMKFRTARRQPLKIFYNAESLRRLFSYACKNSETEIY